MTKASTISPLDELQQPRTIIWTWLSGEALAGILALAPGTLEDRWVVFGLASLLIQWVSLSTLLTLHGTRHLLKKLPAFWLLTAVLLIVVGLTSATYAGISLLASQVDAAPAQDETQGLLRAGAIAFIVSFLALAAFRNHLRLQSMTIRTARAELDALQARIHPHFLFNTLNAGASLIRSKPQAAEQLLLDLSDILRTTLRGAPVVTLPEEVALVQRYLDIEHLRLGERLTVHWHQPETLPSLPLPTLCLQTLVENAVRHGIEPRIGGGTVHFTIEHSASSINISVLNDTPPQGQRPESHGSGLGLPSSVQRIADLHPASTVRLQDAEDHYLVTISIPMDNARI